jgi:hypothetical protein
LDLLIQTSNAFLRIPVQALTVRFTYQIDGVDFVLKALLKFAIHVGPIIILFGLAFVVGFTLGLSH